MEIKKFWTWVKNNKELSSNSVETNELEERELLIDGCIAEDSWFDDDITPAAFREELFSARGPVTVKINSPGGCCIAAAEIYNMLKEYSGKVTVFIDALAASAASVIAMAGDVVNISPVGLLMIHNPSTMAWGDHKSMEQAITLLDATKESIINAYELKTGLSRSKLSEMMDSETWLDATKAVELGFCDNIVGVVHTIKDVPANNCMFSRRSVSEALKNKIDKNAHASEGVEQVPVKDKTVVEPLAEKKGRSVAEIKERLDLMRKFI